MKVRTFFVIAALSAAALPALAAGRSHSQIAMAADASPSPAAMPSPSVSAGKAVFGENCAACHGANAEGGYGPNIRGVKASIVISTVRNPSAKMGKIPINDRQLQDVAAYVASLKP